MSDTPRTSAADKAGRVELALAAMDMERELAAVKERLNRSEWARRLKGRYGEHWADVIARHVADLTVERDAEREARKALEIDRDTWKARYEMERDGVRTTLDA